MTDQEPEDGVDTAAEKPAPKRRTPAKNPPPEPAPEPPEICETAPLQDTGDDDFEEVWPDDDLLGFLDDEDILPDGTTFNAAISHVFDPDTLVGVLNEIRKLRKPRGITGKLYREMRKAATMCLEAMKEPNQTVFLSLYGGSLARLAILLDGPKPGGKSAQKALASLIRFARKDLRKDLKAWKKRDDESASDDLSVLLD